METINKLISQGYNHRKYFFADYDEARKFYYLFDGEFAYAENGYTVTILSHERSYLQTGILQDWCSPFLKPELTIPTKETKWAKRAIR